MKKVFLSIASVSCIALITILSCTKTYNPGTVVNVGPSLNSLFTGLRPVPQSLSVTAGRDTIVYGTKGTMLHFYTYSFKDASGNIITSGTVDLQIIEMYKPGDMIANRTTTMANGQILQSGGEINVVATMNGSPVYTNKYGIGFVHSTFSSAPMALFYAAAGNSDSTVNWSQSDTTQNGTKTNGTTTDTTTLASGSALTSYFYFDTCTSLTFANCDWFYANDSPKTTVSVVMPDTSFNASNTELYLVLPNVNRWGYTADTFTAVLSNAENFDLGAASYNTTTKTMILISESQTNIVPAGLNYELVVIANKNGTYYYWETSGTVPHNGINVNAALAEDSQGDIISRLAGL